MRVALNLEQLFQRPPGGIGRYASQLAKVLPTLSVPGDETGDAAEPGARHLHDIRALLEAGKATCLFPEAGQDPARAALLVDGTPARLGPPLDPEGLTLTTGAGLYDDLLRGLAKAIVSCAAG